MSPPSSFRSLEADGRRLGVTIQILTYTGTNLVKEYDADFMEFLNGFRVME
jgi:hypothetical protein